MTDFKAKMYQIRFRLVLRPRPRWGSLQRSPEPLAKFGGPLHGRGGAGLGNRKERGGEVDGREREGPKLLLNQGPSEPCYATDDLANNDGFVVLKRAAETQKDRDRQIGRHKPAVQQKTAELNLVEASPRV